MEIKIRKLKNRVGKNKANGFVILCILFYSISCIIFSFKLDGFNGLKVVTFITVFAFTALIIIFSFYFEYLKESTKDNFRWMQKKYLLGGIFFVIIVLSFEHNIAALFLFDINKDYNQSKVITGKILGYESIGGSGRSSKETYALLEIYADQNTKANRTYFMCNLIIIERCKFGVYKNLEVTAKISQQKSYPFKYKAIIYELNSKNGELNVSSHQQINLYKMNKLYIIFYIFFILLPMSALFWIVPQKLNSYINSTKY